MSDTPAPEPTAPDLAWFTHDRFGMFVHFGAYSAAGRHEWVKSREQLTDEQYQPYVDHFDPDLFDARALAATAREAGCSYIVLTSKHHDGFCLWASDLTDYTTQHTIGRDLVAEYVEACRAEGLKVGIYHSLLDWHHPDYTVDAFHPLREGNLAELNAGRDMANYRAYLHGQVAELLTRYGTIDLLFFDFTNPEGRNGIPGKTAADWDAETLLDYCRRTQPGIVVNNRLGIDGDYVTPEQTQPTKPILRDGKPAVWEACQTINGSWGYDRDNAVFKDPVQLITMLLQGVSLGGNLILNVGPTGRGNLDPRDEAIFAEIGEWMALHERSIRGCGPADLPAAPNVIYTRNGDRAYAHVLSWPFRELHLPGMAGRIGYAQLLNDGSQVKVREATPSSAEHANTAPQGQDADTATLILPIMRPDVAVPVVELFLNS